MLNSEREGCLTEREKVLYSEAEGSLRKGEGCSIERRWLYREEEGVLYREEEGVLYREGKGWLNRECG